jgi:hypothetical protein
MRNLHELDRYRETDPKALAYCCGWAGDGEHGAFVVPSVIDRQTLAVVASNDEGWDHVSVSRKNRVPNWYEMSQIHRLFFRDDEVAMQLHVPVGQHINAHPHVLHLWRSHTQAISLPPAIFV